MEHFSICLLAVTFSLGVAALLMLVGKYRTSASSSLKYTIGLCASFLFIIAAKVAYEYVWFNIGGTIRVKILFNLLFPSLTIPLVLSFSGMILASFSERVSVRLIRRIVVAVSAVAAAACVYPLLAFDSPAQVFGALRLSNRNFLTPLTCLVLFVPSLAFLAIGGPEDSRRGRSLASYVCAVNAATVVAYALFKFLSTRSPVVGDLLFMISPDFYLFILAVSTLVFILRPDAAASPSVEADAAEETAASARSSPGEDRGGALDADWSRIESYFKRDRVYLDPDLDLAELSRATGIPRNRISRAIRIKTGRNFLAYLNEHRVREFLDTARDPDYSGDILSAAFEAGFNSKATFYSWFKKLTSDTPSGYLADNPRLRG